MLAGEKFCRGDWSKIKKEYRSFNEGELLLFCFSSAYIVALLHDTLKVPLDDKRCDLFCCSNISISHFELQDLKCSFCFRIDVANQIGGVPVDWALGAFIVQKASNQTEYSDSSVPYLNSYYYSGLVPLLFISAVVLFTACSILRGRRSRLKTVYDMEKGRYIITRVRRWALRVVAGIWWSSCGGVPVIVFVNSRSIYTISARQPYIWFWRCLAEWILTVKAALCS